MNIKSHSPQTEPLNASGPKLCLYMNLAGLKSQRASNLEFNNATQHWEVKDRKGKVRFIAKSRSACLEWEQTNLQPD